jgi:hypothetical protein
MSRGKTRTRWALITRTAQRARQGEGDEARPASAWEGYVGWPLWYQRVCLVHNRAFGWLYILGLVGGAVTVRCGSHPPPSAASDRGCINVAHASFAVVQTCVRGWCDDVSWATIRYFHGLTPSCATGADTSCCRSVTRRQRRTPIRHAWRIVPTSNVPAVVSVTNGKTSPGGHRPAFPRRCHPIADLHDSQGSSGARTDDGSAAGAFSEPANLAPPRRAVARVGRARARLPERRCRVVIGASAARPLAREVS